MIAKILRNEQEYEIACKRVYDLMSSTDKIIDPKSKEGEEMSLMALLIENFELARIIHELIYYASIKLQNQALTPIFVLPIAMAIAVDKILGQHLILLLF